MEADLSVPSTGQRLPAAARRAVIIRAAGRVFGRAGYSGARLDDIAAAAAVSKPILYRHFDSKKALYLALLEKHEADLPGFFAGLDAPAPDLPTEAPVRAILDGWLDYVIENRHAWLMLFRDSSGDEEIREARARVSLTAREVLAGFIALGPSRMPAEQVTPTAEMIVSGLAGLALWWIDHPDVAKGLILDVATRITEPALAGI